MIFDGTTASLMAVAASVAANCERCLEINVARSVRLGAPPEAIAEAVELGRKVRAGAAAKLDARAAALDIASGGAAGIEAEERFDERSCAGRSAERISGPRRPW